MASRNHDQGGVFTHKIKTGGEVTVNLVLTIKLDSDGLSLAAVGGGGKSAAIIDNSDDDDVKFIVPDIHAEDMIQFGESVNEKGKK